MGPVWMLLSSPTILQQVTRNPHPTPFICLTADDPPVLFSPHIHLHVDVNMHKKCASLPPPAEYSHHRCTYISPTQPPPPKKKIHHATIYTRGCNYPPPVYDNTNIPADDVA